MVAKRIKILPRTNLWSTSGRDGTVIPDNFPTEYDLDVAIIMTKLYYISLRQDGTDIEDDVSDDDDSGEDDSGEDYFTDINGALSLTLKANQRNTLFINLIDSFQYAPVLFSINQRDKTR